MKYVALLRGINVGSANQVAMTDLVRAFDKYTDVATHLRSGNVVFSAASFTPSALIALEDDIATATGVQARVLVLSGTSFTAVAAANPLLDVATDPSRLITTFLEAPKPDVSVPASLDPERMVLTDTAIYQWCPDGVSKSKVPPAFWRKVGPVATARNQRTVERLLTMLA
ncbi:DUF1697 domain-containing protein [soil metagenome]